VILPRRTRGSGPEQEPRTLLGRPQSRTAARRCTRTGTNPGVLGVRSDGLPRSEPRPPRCSIRSMLDRRVDPHGGAVRCTERRDRSVRWCLGAFRTRAGGLRSTGGRAEAVSYPCLRATERSPGTSRHDTDPRFFDRSRPRRPRRAGAELVNLRDRPVPLAANEPEPSGGRRTLEGPAERALPPAWGLGRKVFSRHLDAEVAGAQGRGRPSGRGR
jgi:hypothetical protein